MPHLSKFIWVGSRLFLVHHELMLILIVSVLFPLIYSSMLESKYRLPIIIRITIKYNLDRSTKYLHPSLSYSHRGASFKQVVLFCVLHTLWPISNGPSPGPWVSEEVINYHWWKLSHLWPISKGHLSGWGSTKIVL